MKYYLLGLDFDGTIANTLAPNRKGVDVRETYRLACAEVFGETLGTRLYEEVGGLQNRSPGQFVQAVLTKGDTEELVTFARKYLKEHAAKLACLMPQGKGGALEWNCNPHPMMTELIVRVKLRILGEQVGTSCDGGLWPLPCRGFVEFWHALHACQRELAKSDTVLMPGILSSGHDHFISLCFKSWGLGAPILMVTDDTMRSAAYAHLPLERRSKPSIEPFRVMCEALLPQGEQEGALEKLQPTSCFAGDCKKFDLGLAENLDIPFFWFARGDRVLQRSTEGVTLTDWRLLAPKLFGSDSIAMMKEGQAFATIVESVF